MITLYHFPLSPCGEKVRLALAEKGLAWREVIVDLTRKQNLAPDYLRLNPKGLVPTLVDGAVVVVESTVIIEYLDDAYPAPPLRPPLASARADMRTWTKLVDEQLHPAWPGIAWTILVRPAWLKRTPDEVETLLDALLDPRRRERQRRLYRDGFDADDARAAISTFTATLDRSERSLAWQPWLAGDSLSLADLALLPYLLAADRFGLGELLGPARPRVQAWYARCRARPALSSIASGLLARCADDPVAQVGAEAVQRFRALGLLAGAQDGVAA